MKKIKVCLVLLPMFTMACADEYSSEIDKTTQKINYEKKKDNTAGNWDNPYDIAGIFYIEILDILDQTIIKSCSIEEVAVLVDSVSANYLESKLLTGSLALSSKIPEIIQLINNGNTINNVLTGSALGPNAQESFLSFIDSVNLAIDQPYENIYRVIVDYENNIVHTLEYADYDKRILLATTSFMRYYTLIKDREDKDWDTSIGRIAAVVSGTQLDLFLGVKIALTTEICKRNFITR